MTYPPTSQYQAIFPLFTCCKLCSTFNVWHFQLSLDVWFSIRQYRNGCFSSLALREAKHVSRGGLLLTCAWGRTSKCWACCWHSTSSQVGCPSFGKEGRKMVNMSCICQWSFCSTCSMACSPGHEKNLPLWRTVFLVGAADSLQRLCLMISSPARWFSPLCWEIGCDDLGRHLFRFGEQTLEGVIKKATRECYWLCKIWAPSHYVIFKTDFSNFII